MIDIITFTASTIFSSIAAWWHGTSLTHCPPAETHMGAFVDGTERGLGLYAFCWYIGESWLITPFFVLNMLTGTFFFLRRREEKGGRINVNLWF